MPVRGAFLSAAKDTLSEFTPLATLKFSHTFSSDHKFSKFTVAYRYPTHTELRAVNWRLAQQTCVACLPMPGRPCPNPLEPDEPVYTSGSSHAAAANELAAIAAAHQIESMLSVLTRADDAAPSNRGMVRPMFRSLDAGVFAGGARVSGVGGLVRLSQHAVIIVTSFTQRAFGR